MRLKHLLITVISLTLLTTGVFAKELKIGKTAPDFSLKDTQGKTHNLKDYRGKYVVLEWINYDCPFVKKHYNAGNMQMLQKTYTAQDVIWLSINSSAEGKQGRFTSEEVIARSNEHGAAPTAYLQDADGRVGKWYGAKTTPHMYIIDPKGKVAYMGAIDDIKSTKVKDVPKATNYVSAALNSLLAGEKVKVTTSKPYGCSVKY